MSHIRAQVRAAALAAVTGLPTTGARAYVAHERPLNADELPCVLVAVSDTAVSDSLSAPLTLRRTVLIEIQAVAKAAAGVVDTLDLIALEVEQALGAGLTVDAKLFYPRYTGAGAADLSVEIDRPVGALSITFELDLFTASTDVANVL